MGNCWAWLWRKTVKDDPFSLEPIVGGAHPIPMLDRSLEDVVKRMGYLVFSTRMSEGQPTYRLDLQPPFALRSANGNIIAFMERYRDKERPHMLVLHGKADEFSAVNAQDYSRYYQIRVASEPMLTDSGRATGLRHIGTLWGGLRSDHTPLSVLMNPPGLYSPDLAVMPMQEGGGRC